MSSISPVILILGAGPNVGKYVAQTFAAKGYKVALTSRNPKPQETSSNQLTIASDLSNPKSVADVFSQVKASLGLPSVVVYNAAAATQSNPRDPLSLPLDDFTRDFAVNTTSALAAAQQAIACFEQLPDSASKTFIYTGNALNTTTMAPLLSLGVGKSATAHVIQLAAAAYADRGFKCVYLASAPVVTNSEIDVFLDRFYYADERTSDGKPAFMDIDGEAHGKFYLELAEGKRQGPWQQAFVKGVGYRSF